MAVQRPVLRKRKKEQPPPPTCHTLHDVKIRVQTAKSSLCSFVHLALFSRICVKTLVSTDRILSRIMRYAISHCTYYSQKYHSCCVAPGSAVTYAVWVLRVDAECLSAGNETVIATSTHVSVCWGGETSAYIKQ